MEQSLASLHLINIIRALHENLPMEAATVGITVQIFNVGNTSILLAQTKWNSVTALPEKNSFVIRVTVIWKKQKIGKNIVGNYKNKRKNTRAEINTTTNFFNLFTFVIRKHSLILGFDLFSQIHINRELIIHKVFRIVLSVYRFFNEHFKYSIILLSLGELLVKIKCQLHCI